MSVLYAKGYKPTDRDFQSILVPTLPADQLLISSRISQAQEVKLFKDEVLKGSTNGPDDPYLFYISQGQMRFESYGEDGSPSAVLWRNEGNAFLNEYAGLASIAGAYPTRFIATKNSVLYAFTQRQIYEFAQEDPDFFTEYLRICHITFAQITHRVAICAHQLSDVRLAVWLKKLCATVSPSPDGSYDVPCNMTVRQIADYLMIHETTCSKCIAEFKRQGLIARNPGGFHIFSMSQLCKYIEQKTL